VLSPATNIDLKGIAEKFSLLDNFVICGHVNPDGDCLGSQLALALALRSQGKTVTCLLANDVPIDPALQVLPGVSDMIPAGQFGGSADVFIVCDVSALDRIGNDAATLQASAKTTFTIDHHQAETSISQYSYINPSMASTTMIVWELIKEMQVEVTPDMALCTYTGLLSDTGSFRYQNADVKAFNAAAEMVSAGVNPSEVAASLFQSRSLASLRLEALLLSKMLFDEEKAYAISYLSLADFESCKAEKADAELMIDVLRSIEGVRVACFLRETSDGIRVSLRAKDTTDISLIAKKFNGGGHKAAAGCTINASLKEANHLVRAAIEAMI